MVRQKTLKASIKVLDNSEKEKNIGLGVKKPVVQILSPATSILILKIGQPASSGTPSPISLSGYVFANIQNANIYKKFMTTDNKM